MSEIQLLPAGERVREDPEFQDFIEQVLWAIHTWGHNSVDGFDRKRILQRADPRLSPTQAPTYAHVVSSESGRFVAKHSLARASKSGLVLQARIMRELEETLVSNTGNGICLRAAAQYALIGAQRQSALIMERPVNEDGVPYKQASLLPFKHQSAVQEVVVSETHRRAARIRPYLNDLHLGNILIPHDTEINAPSDTLEIPFVIIDQPHTSLYARGRIHAAKINRCLERLTYHSFQLFPHRPAGLR